MSKLKGALLRFALAAIVIDGLVIGVLFWIDWIEYSKAGRDVTHMLAEKLGSVTTQFREDFGIDPSGATGKQFLLMLGAGFPICFGLTLWLCGKLEKDDSGGGG
ncbi:MAG: hypothetical protein ACC661_04910 [Verrucomicrobiales bacterium]